MNSGEQFITVIGTGLGNRLVFDGPAGHFEVNVNATFSDRVVGWVPEAIIAKSGTYSLTVTGPNGSSGPATFTVKGFKLPLAILLPEYVRVQPRTREGVAVTYDVFATDSGASVSCDPKSGSFFPMGTTIVKCIATNIAGERATGSFPVYVRDEEPPVIKVPEKAIVVGADSREGTIVKFEALAFDDVYGELQVDCLPASGSLFHVGITTVQCSATDPDLNVGHGVFDVEVRGEVEWYPLDVIVPEDILVDAKDPRGAEVSFEVYVKGTDDREPAISCTHKSGEVFPVGDTFVTCDALDMWGMRGSSNFRISVLDRVAPQILELKASPDLLTADGRIYSIEVFAQAVDDIDFEPRCEVYDVTSKEDIDLDDFDDPKSYDWQITGPLKLELRAERHGTTRVYNVWVLCSDYFGNHEQSRVSVAVTGGTASKATGPTKSGRRRSAR
ncbi:MAG TPA: HYR domain-containing protein [Thermoanaerobaculia bacterium]|nr:HYR domain-containing protein [Thermoanaerobaculia bacterium]